ncbi:MAG: methylated-DNA--[protein]-cysteine S-methyltransferase [Pirellulales bacterium]
MQATLQVPNLPADKMYSALVNRDTSFDGIFYAAIKTTGIFCRPSCTARKPLASNVLYFSTVQDCLAAGYRACKRCRPMEVSGAMPHWLVELLRLLDGDSHRRWTNREIQNMGVEPSRVNRWFENQHGMTFQKYLRLRRLTQALHQLSLGEDMLQVASNAGYESLSGFREGFQKAFGITAGAAKTASNPILVNRILTPLGPMVIAADENELLLLEFADRRMLQTQFSRLATRKKIALVPGENSIMERTNRQIHEYFDGSRDAFELPLGLVGTDFQRAVWRALLQIPFGQRTNYERIAASIGSPGASRAVGTANGDNRIAIVIPCHRVVRADGSLSGYGGSVWRKDWLLRHEVTILDARS